MNNDMAVSLGIRSWDGLTVLIWKQFEFLGLYEIVPGFLFSSIAIYVVSIMDKLPPRPVLKDYKEAEKMHVL